MQEFFSRIKSVGFDLDNTLYESNPEIESRIEEKIASEAIKLIPEFKDVESMKKSLKELYKETGSRTEVFRKLGFQKPGEFVTECMARADILDLINSNAETASLIVNLSKKYHLFLITAAIENLALPRIEKMGIDYSLFKKRIFGDTALQYKKTDASIFKYFLSGSPYSAEEHVFIGDNLKGDILPAKSLGMKTIAVGSEFPEADFSVKNLSLIEKLLL